MRARLRRFYLNGRKRAIFFFVAQVKLPKNGDARQGRKARLFSSKIVTNRP